MLILAVPA